MFEGSGAFIAFMFFMTLLAVTGFWEKRWLKLLYVLMPSFIIDMFQCTSDLFLWVLFFLCLLLFH
jgi:hypothetical protein